MEPHGEAPGAIGSAPTCSTWCLDSALTAEGRRGVRQRQRRLLPAAAAPTCLRPARRRSADVLPDSSAQLLFCNQQAMRGRWWPWRRPRGSRMPPKACPGCFRAIPAHPRLALLHLAGSSAEMDGHVATGAVWHRPRVPRGVTRRFRPHVHAFLPLASSPAAPFPRHLPCRFLFRHSRIRCRNKRRSVPSGAPGQVLPAGRRATRTPVPCARSRRRRRARRG